MEREKVQIAPVKPDERQSEQGQSDDVVSPTRSGEHENDKIVEQDDGKEDREPQVDEEEERSSPRKRRSAAAEPALSTTKLILTHSGGHIYTEMEEWCLQNELGQEDIGKLISQRFTTVNRIQKPDKEYLSRLQLGAYGE